MKLFLAIALIGVFMVVLLMLLRPGRPRITIERRDKIDEREHRDDA